MEPYRQVKAYPAFKSGKPIYGRLECGGDENNPANRNAFYFAVDESAGSGKGYDRFYFDRNGDLDLCNEPALGPLREPPAGARVLYRTILRQNCFEPVTVPLDRFVAGAQAVEVLPRVMHTQEGEALASFLCTKARWGEFAIGTKQYEVLLGQDCWIAGRFDLPGTFLKYRPQDGNWLNHSWWNDRLRALHPIDGHLYRFSATPAGDRITVSRYSGEFGVFELGAGGRQLPALFGSGVLESRDTALALALDGAPPGEEGKQVSRWQVPAGDYRPIELELLFGALSISLSDNYHSDGKPRDLPRPQVIYGIRITKDKPYVFDFSGKPEVLFASPAKARRIKRGETLEVLAVLIEPRLDLMIRGLEDTAAKDQGNANASGVSGRLPKRLHPQVTITRAGGEKVAEGLMPFG
jgi:hypothetical protein